MSESYIECIQENLSEPVKLDKLLLGSQPYIFFRTYNCQSKGRYSGTRYQSVNRIKILVKLLLLFRHLENGYLPQKGEPPRSLFLICIGQI